MEHEHREYFETGISKFLHRAAEEAAGFIFHATAAIMAFLENWVEYEETAEIANKMEAETAGRWRDHKMGEEKTECAVCFEEVEVSII